MRNQSKFQSAMRPTILCALCSVLCGGVFAADMTGEYNTWLGYIAGINASGNRTTVQGAGAGGEAKNLVCTDLIGAAAGAYSADINDCIGIGYGALSSCSNISSSVAIGTGVMRGVTNIHSAVFIGPHAVCRPSDYNDGAVDINGKFVSHGGDVRIRNEFGVDIFHYSEGKMTLTPGDNETRELCLNVTKLTGTPEFTNSLATLVNSDFNSIKTEISDIQAWRNYRVEDRLEYLGEQVTLLKTALVAATNRIAQLEAKH